MKIKKFLSIALTAAMALSLAAPAAAAKPAKNDKTAASSESIITLKGEQSGTEFEYDKECWSTWKNVIFLGGANGNSTDEEVSAWHLVYTDKKGVNNDLKSMKLTFENGEVYEWSWDAGLSANGSGNNPGWMVVAPASYGRIDVAKSFIVTTSSKNVQFNISGYYEAGSKPVEPDDDSITNIQWGKLEYTTPEVTEEYTEIWHELAYDKFTSVETLVSTTGCTPGGKNYTCTENHGVLPDCVVEHGAHTNGFTWLKFDKTQLQTETKGVNIGISDKNKDIPDVAPENPWEEPVAPYYNVRIVGDDLVVTSNLKNFVARVYNSVDKIEFNPSVHSGDKKEITVPLTGIGDQLYLFLHFANKNGYEYEDATTAYHTGKTVERECKRPYTGTVTVTVTDAAGKAVTDLNKMAPGEYTVTVTASGQTLNTQTVTVNPGETAAVTFPGNLTVQGADEYHCANPDCDLNKSSVEG